MNKIIQHNVKNPLPLANESVNCCVTSPPYWGLRDYGQEEQLGLEKTPEEYVQNIVNVFREVKRVLKPDGTLWLNLGDSYANPSKSGGGDPSIGKRNLGDSQYPNLGVPNGLKPKDLVGIPWMVAFALRADGWYLRQDIIWHKPNPMPESVTDRCTKSHEYIFLLSKSPKYYYDHDSIKQNLTDSSIQRLSQDIQNQEGSDRVPGKTNGKMKAVSSWKGSSFDTGKTAIATNNGRKIKLGEKSFSRGQANGLGVKPSGNSNNEYYEVKDGANKRSVWTVSTKPFSEAHFATFPQNLIVDCIKAGCPEGGIVLNPFMGAGTTAIVSRKLNRNYIGFELNPTYIKIAEKRIYKELGLFV